MAPSGTSTIQAFTRQRGKIMADEDNYDASMVLLSVPPSMTMSHLETCLRQKHCVGKRFNRTMVYNESWAIGAAKGRSVFLSNEHLARSDFDFIEWKKYVAFLQQYYRVRIILLYRRYYEWLPSWYNQFFKFEGKYGTRVAMWPPMTEEERTGANKDGVEIPSFPDYFERTLQFDDGDEFARRDRQNPTTGQPSHNIVELHRTFRAQALHVVVQNYHDDGSGSDLLTTFFCDSMPLAKKMCELAKEAKGTKANKSDRDKFDYDLIAVEARRQGLIPLVGSWFTRRRTKRRIQEWLKKTPEVNNALPWICLSSARIDLLQSMSYEFESYMAPYLSPNWILDHNQSFTEAVSRNLFCSVDARKVLEDSRLRDHLRAFANETG